MPFGLTTVPAVFQNLVNEILGDMINKFVFVYLDDILIFSKSEAEHIKRAQCATETSPEQILCEGREMWVSLCLSLASLSAGEIKMDLAKV